MRQDDFNVGVRIKREDQQERYGVRDHSLPRWALIINTEVGKLNRALNEADKSRGDVTSHLIKAKDQCFEVAACLLAMLQECKEFSEEGLNGG